MIKKLCVVLCLVTFSGLYFIPPCGAAGELTVSCIAENVRFPVGMTVMVTAQKTVSTAFDEIDFYTSDNGTDYTFLCKAEDLSSPACSIVLTDYKQYIIAKMLYKGNVLYTSSSISVKGYTFNKTKTCWDLDFENITLNTDASPPYVALCSENGQQLLNNYGNRLRGHTGSSQSKIEIADGIDGKCLSLTSGNTTDNVQLNEFFATVSEDIASFEFDYSASDFNTNKVVMAVNYYDIDGNTRFADSLNLSTTGEFTFAGKAVPCVLNKYNRVVQWLDLNKNTLSCFVNDVYMGSTFLAYDAVATNRVSSQTRSGALTNVKIDNFSVVQYSISDVVDNANFFVDGERTDRLSEGNLSVDLTLSKSDGYDKLLTLFCVYDEDRLVDVFLEKVQFDSDKPVKSKIDFGHLSDNVDIKVMIWESSDNLKPMYKVIRFDKYGMFDTVVVPNESNTVFESDDESFEFMQNKLSYHTRSGLVCKNGSKKIVLPLPIERNGCLLAPLKVYQIMVGNTTADENSGVINIGNTLSFTVNSTYMKINGVSVQIQTPPVFENGTFYIPFYSVFETGLSKVITLVTDVKSSGLMIISDTSVTLPSNLQGLNEYLLYQRPSAEDILADYENSGFKNVHPRLLATAEDFDNIRSSIQTDSKMKSWYSSIIYNANSLLSKEPLVYELRDGVRLWYVSLDFIQRISCLSMAYNLTKLNKYSDRAWLEMEAVTLFDDWHPAHHIDVGGMAVGYAIGYDWLYNAYTPQQRDILERGVLKHCFSEYNSAYQGLPGNMGGVTAKNNHNVVMNSGSLMCAVAFFDKYPEISSYMISGALRATEVCLRNFTSDGSWYEGISYGFMTAQYAAFELAAAKKVFGHIYGLDRSEGIDKAAEYFLYMQCPTGSYAYSDGGSDVLQFDPSLFWLTKNFGSEAVMNKWLDTYSLPVTLTGCVAALLWYYPKSSENIELNLDKYFKEDEVITMRNSWENSKPSFVGIKGGRPADDHGHMDVGSFSFYSGGTKWTKDLGAENYNLNGYWNWTGRTGKRWQYFRLRAEAHNCLVVDPDYYAEYEPDTKAKFSKTELNGNGAIAILNMSDSLGNKVSGAKRGFYFTDERQSLVIRDEITTVASKTSDVYWFFITGQNVEIYDNYILLRDKNNSVNTLKIEYLCNYGLEVTAATPAPLPTSPNPAGLASNEGYTRIALKTRGTGNINITVKLTPGAVSGSNISDYNIPMDTWN